MHGPSSLVGLLVKTAQEHSLKKLGTPSGGVTIVPRYGGGGSHAAASSEAEGLAALRQALVEADEADIILLSGMSREDWLAQLDRGSTDGGRRVGLPILAGKARPVGA